MTNPENAVSNSPVPWALTVPRVNWEPQLPQGDSMAKGQQKTNKESKKPKKVEVKEKASKSSKQLLTEDPQGRNL